MKGVEDFLFMAGLGHFGQLKSHAITEYIYKKKVFSHLHHLFNQMKLIFFEGLLLSHHSRTWSDKKKLMIYHF